MLPWHARTTILREGMYAGKVRFQVNRTGTFSAIRAVLEHINLKRLFTEVHCASSVCFRFHSAWAVVFTSGNKVFSVNFQKRLVFFRKVTFQPTSRLHCKKRLPVFPSPAGMSLTKFPAIEESGLRGEVNYQVTFKTYRNFNSLVWYVWIEFVGLPSLLCIEFFGLSSLLCRELFVLSSL